ncbi:peptide chain release factor 2 [mine drainage metagenome]|uniref:Peptide chain release factor 2 n=2 Tax=mine drainage metagenome TaxID=410659 RepID=T1A7G2_9ZZZZ
MEEIEKLMEDPGLWNARDRAQELGRERAGLEQTLSLITELEQQQRDLKDLWELIESEGESGLVAAWAADLDAFESRLGEMEFQRMFSGEMDGANAFLDIQAGAGGTEAQDWASVLLRMYLRWADRHKMITEIVDESPGEVAGIKGVSVRIEGPFAYGWLRTETGVHRLVRKSPFDSGNRRHTSFAGVFVSPEIDDSIEVEINPADLKVDTFRASGAGGQHVNRTESAIRITHLPSGIVVSCQSDRSQHKNRATAMKRLRARLYEMELQKKLEARQKLESVKNDINFGSQIRSYVLDQSRVKDLRTGMEVGTPQTVLDGDLDAFLIASLQQGGAT